MSVKFFKQLSLIFTICFAHFLTAQNLTSKQIDSLSTASQLLRTSGEIEKFLHQQQYLNKESHKIDYPKGVAMSYFHSGVAYQMLGKNDDAIDYFNLSKKLPYTQSNWALQSEIEKTLGETYGAMGLYKESIMKFKTAIKFAEKENDSKVGVRKVNNYNNIGIAFGSIPKSTDSIYYYYSKANYYTKFPSNDVPRDQQNALKSLVLSNLGWVLDTKNETDSARYYFREAIELNKKANNVVSNINVNYMMGDSYVRSKEYKTAIQYFNESLKYALEAENTYAQRDNYQNLANVYKLLKDDKKYIEYTDLYIKLDKKVKASELRATNKSIDTIVKDKETNFEKSKSKLYWIICGILLLAAFISLFAFWFHQNMKKKKDDAISDSEERLAQKREIIEQKEYESRQLKLKLNESFEEVVQLAKENSSEFLTRFQEVYPDYYQKLVNIQPQLLMTEVKLCAMIYLGFSTKDIAEYTFVTIKAAQHRKFRLRKKLDIPSDADINDWLKKCSEKLF